MSATEVERPAWAHRFTAPWIDFPRWDASAPDRCVYLSNESGISQAWTWDVATGERRQASNEGVGVEAVFPLPDGSGAAWWADPTGDERGRWMVTPFAGGEARALTSTLPETWGMGVSVVPGLIAIGSSTEQEYSVHIIAEGQEPRLIARQEAFLAVGREWVPNAGGLSGDGSLLCLIDGSKGDINHLALRVIDPASGGDVGELYDEGYSLTPIAWSPVAGDQRLLIQHDREGTERPAIWDPATGELRDLKSDLPGPITEPAAWSLDGESVLLVHQPDGRSQLVRWTLETGELEALTEPAGVIGGVGARPDGDLWLRIESAAEPPKIVSLGGEEVLAPTGHRAPGGTPYGSLAFDNPHGQRVHGFLATPEGAGPFPTVLMVHGGPEWAYPDDFDPWTQALVDHGYAVAKINYRGSTGYGVAWRQALIGNYGFPETEDLIAGLDALVERGIVDPGRVAIEGWSWGGYLSLLVPGLHPDRFAAALAGIPVGDSAMCHYECAPALQAYDVAMLGGTPQEIPDVYRERSPITYVDAIACPVLLIAGESDSRCPIGQVRHYMDALRVRGKPVTLHTYESGHHANSIDEQLMHAELELAFLAEHLHG